MKVRRSSVLPCLLVVSLSCSDGPLPTDSDDARPERLAGAAIISDPAAAPSTSTRVYVSAPPGAFPNSGRAFFVNRRTSSSVSITLVGGGLDPIAIEGAAGDSLAFAVDTGGPEPARFTQLVPLVMRPRIVRTDPAAGKRDVPLNALIRIIFSEPMDVTTITGSTLGLSKGGRPVSGQVALSSDGLVATFQPDTDLQPETDYTIMVGAGIRDDDGSEIDAPPTTEFTTVTSDAEPLGAIEIVVERTGDDLNGEYLATVDRGFAVPFYLSSSDRAFYLPGLTVGRHVVSLSPPRNCAVGNIPQTVTVVVGELPRVSFPVTCNPFVGAVQITGTTTGNIPSGTRYSVRSAVEGPWDYGPGEFRSIGALEPNGSLVLPLGTDRSGSFRHYFMLEDVPATCAVEGNNPKDAGTLNFQDTLKVEFRVTCPLESVQ